MTIKSPKDFWAGILYIAFGSCAMLIALNYPMGSAGRMGPGYFPRVLGALLVLLGVVLSVRGLRLNGGAIILGSPRPLVVVLGSVVIFGLAIGKVGMAIATLLLVVISSAASSEFRWRESVVAAVILSAFAVGAFAYGLGVQMPIWPPFLQ